MYPLWLENGASIRKELQKQKLFVPTLWPDVFECCDSDSLEYKMAADILPVPCDQRYDSNDMSIMIELIKEKL